MRIFIKRRDMKITRRVIAKTPIVVYVHKGKSFSAVTLTRSRIGHRVGEFSLTKRLGARIHDSARNRKRKEKMKMHNKKIKK